MNVTIIGSGNMAKAIGTRLVNGGHDLTIHAKDLNKANKLVDGLKSVKPPAKVRVDSIGADTDEVVIFAVPYTEIQNLANDYKGLAGKVVIDITNPVDFNTFQLIPEPGQSGAQEVAKLLPDTKVVKAFNTTLAGPLEVGVVDGKQLDVFIAGDDQEAKDTVIELIKTSAMRPVDVGPLANSRHLEGLGLIQMAVQDQIGTNWMSAIKFIN